MVMDLNRFRQCAAAFGAKRRRWPEAERPLFDRFAASAEGAAVLAEAGRSDALLDALAPAAPDARLVRRIIAVSRPAWRRLLVPAAALAACALLGFAVGFAQARGEAGADVVGPLLLGPRSLQEAGL
jgi:hypothetical protein